VSKAFILIGGNLGNRLENLQEVVRLIEKYCGKIISQSSIYETAAWGKKDQPDFLNQVLEIETNLQPRKLINTVLEIEKMMGRERDEKYGPRIIDIDILFFNEEVVDESFLKIPHPELQKRRFVLIPLAEIAPHLNHPVLKKNIDQLLKECKDGLEVKRYH
jgi:2-amino-4-hydroxy-6-hydroxymethyldihydropteridine diphosphokinase